MLCLVSGLPPLDSGISAQLFDGRVSASALEGCSLACCYDPRCKHVWPEHSNHSPSTATQPAGLADSLEMFLHAVDVEEQAQDKVSDVSVLNTRRELDRNSKFQDKISAAAQDVHNSMEMLRQRQSQIEASKAQAVGRMDFQDAEEVRKVRQAFLNNARATSQAVTLLSATAEIILVVCLEPTFF